MQLIKTQNMLNIERAWNSSRRVANVTTFSNAADVDGGLNLLTTKTITKLNTNGLYREEASGGKLVQAGWGGGLLGDVQASKIHNENFNIYDSSLQKTTGSYSNGGLSKGNVLGLCGFNYLSYSWQISGPNLGYGYFPLSGSYNPGRLVLLLCNDDNPVTLATIGPEGDFMLPYSESFAKRADGKYDEYVVSLTFSSDASYPDPIEIKKILLAAPLDDGNYQSSEDWYQNGYIVLAGAVLDSPVTPSKGQVLQLNYEVPLG